ncbi:hypothetical protein PSN45_000409 [Yamadazyma tenuis]|uniref:Major facilitator superfamily (MFS) profile domain-containing protein n=2 Tax=Candida tenuis (strain ATCC 10573 / BCRC 21748 / CBS 615 / JCM 9827 / NBRC 10315 / NRRL Y-1498 / VKM Y-70) TaxID=590646 RepID=G3B895_CANTC|nr:uncharacterized protein CANTEDRAFT_94607 [Yamadazyma tenuis ATCC 10573]EGV61718.1 hypothetical protein CANTEDRAFT_94607 [Yamadazyma tenuis ATCC 10573]WEJ92951.1 hypothetical protein PSN45_000409 [Yamadazyma tenuis]
MGLEDSKLLQKYLNFGERKAGSTSMGIFVGLFAAFGGILFGYDTGTISGIMAMKYVTERFPQDIPNEFSSSEKSLIVSILSVGTFFGALGAPFLSDTLGRRWTLIIGTLVVFNLGIVLQTAATDIPLLCAGRAIAGLGVGLISAVIPLYQSETLPKWIRGAVVSLYQWAITIGLLLAGCVIQGTHNRNDSGSYRIPIAIQFLWALILGIGMFFLPETPRFFISKSRDDEAKESLKILRKLPIDHPDLVEEFEDMKAAFEFERTLGGGGWLDVFSNKNKQLKRLITGTSIQAFQQLTGVNFIFYFGTTFFKSSGIGNEFLISLATNIVNVGMTIPGVILIEVIGRRKLLLGGSVVMSVSQLIIAIVGVTSQTKSSNNVLVAFTCIFIGAFASSWGPTCWALIGEMFPLTTRAKSVAISTASNWLWNWAIAYATPYMVDSGPGNANLGSKVFFIWGGFNLIGMAFTYLMVYETKGLTLEQVDELYEAVPNAWNSAGFVPTEHAFRNNLAESIQSDTKQEAVSENESV